MTLRLSERVLAMSVFRGREIDVLEVVFLALIGISCLLQLVGNTEPTSIALLLPAAFRTVWLIMMTVGSIGALAGIFWPKDLIDGILLEIIGLAWVAVSVLIYGAAQEVAVVVNGSALGGLMAGSLTILIGLGFGLKAMRLQGVIERLKKK